MVFGLYILLDEKYDVKESINKNSIVRKKIVVKDEYHSLKTVLGVFLHIVGIFFVLNSILF